MYAIRVTSLTSVRTLGLYQTDGSRETDKEVTLTNGLLFAGNIPENNVRNFSSNVRVTGMSFSGATRF